MIRRICMTSAFVLSLAFTAAGYADVYDKTVPVIIEASQISQWHRERIKEIETQAMRRVDRKKLPPMRAEQLKADVLKEIAELDKSYGWGVIEPKFIDRYRQLFSKSEIQAIAEFLNSSAGKVFMAKTPAITEELLGESMDQLAQITREMKAFVDARSGIASQ